MIGIIIEIITHYKKPKKYRVCWCDLPPAAEPSGRMQILRIRLHSPSEIEWAYPDSIIDQFNAESLCDQLKPIPFQKMKLLDIVVRTRP